MTPVRTFVVSADAAGVRLDKLVGAHETSLGRRALARLFEQGGVRVDGRAARKGDAARAGTTVEVRLAAPEDGIIAEPERPLRVLAASPNVVVVSKPAGQPTAPLRSDETGTLANALVAHYPEMRGVGYRAREPGIVHRLDNQTSGIVVAARNAVAFEHIRGALERGEIDKRYLAVVEAAGLPAEGLVDRPLGPDPSDPRRVVTLSGARDPARETRWRRVRVEGPWALVEVSVHRAYRHQVRVHLAELGHPIAGDPLYGGAPAESLGSRQALHASQVAWAGDAVVEGFDVDDPLPAAMEALIAG